MVVIQMLIVIFCSFLLVSGLFILWMYQINFLFCKSNNNQDEKDKTKKAKVIILIILSYCILRIILLYN